MIFGIFKVLKMIFSPVEAEFDQLFFLVLEGSDNQADQPSEHIMWELGEHDDLSPIDFRELSLQVSLNIRRSIKDISFYEMGYFWSFSFWCV